MGGAIPRLIVLCGVRKLNVVEEERRKRREKGKEEASTSSAEAALKP